MAQESDGVDQWDRSDPDAPFISSSAVIASSSRQGAQGRSTISQSRNPIGPPLVGSKSRSGHDRSIADIENQSLLANGEASSEDEEARHDQTNPNNNNGTGKMDRRFRVVDNITNHNYVASRDSNGDHSPFPPKRSAGLGFLSFLRRHRQGNEESRTSEPDIWSSRDSSFMWRFVLILLTLMILAALVAAYFATMSSRTAPSVDSVEQFPKFIQAARIGDHLKLLTSQEHLAGTMSSKKQAQLIHDQWIASGGVDQVDIVSYECLISKSEFAELTLRYTNGTSFAARLKEGAIEGDSTSVLEDGLVMPIPTHGYSPSGKVTAGVIYANYGSERDFQLLTKAGVVVKGKIALIRYGHLFRGIKVRNAQNAGAIGVLIYSDPADDGFSKGPVYPEGAFRPDTAVQRGSVLFASQCGGDPSTPDGPSEPGASRLTLEEIQDKCIPKIPSLPISWKNAMFFLQALDQAAGSAQPPEDDFLGGLAVAPFNVRYKVGPSDPVLQATIEQRTNFSIEPIYNVIGVLRGSMEPDRMVLVGNHHDAWVFGAADPSSGTATMMEVLFALGRLRQEHPDWRPRRSIMFASWDGEEYNLLGSTEFAEGHAASLSSSAVGYINVDVAVSGHNFEAASNPMMSKLIQTVVDGVTVPGQSESVGVVWKREFSEMSGNDLSDLIAPPGGGTDFVAFQHKFGISSAGMGFDGMYGVYHSLYDSYSWMLKVDPDFAYHHAMVNILGKLALTIAESRVLPYSASDYLDFMVNAVKDMANKYPYAFTPEITDPLLGNGKSNSSSSTAASSADDLAQLLTSRDYEIEQRQVSELAGANSTLTLPYSPSLLGFVLLVDSIKKFGAAVSTIESQISNVETRGLEQILVTRQVNDRLMLVEREFLLLEGLPDRTWFKHALFAPDFDTDYTTEVFPGIQRYLRQNMTVEADLHAMLVANCISRAAITLSGL